jgi:hypothetical protein
MIAKGHVVASYNIAYLNSAQENWERGLWGEKNQIKRILRRARKTRASSSLSSKKEREGLK